MENDEDGFDWAGNAWSEAVLDLIKSEPLPSTGDQLRPVHESFSMVLAADEMHDDWPDQNPTWNVGAPMPYSFVVRSFAYLLDGVELTVDETEDPKIVDRVVASCFKSNISKIGTHMTFMGGRRILKHFPEPDKLKWSHLLSHSEALRSFLANPNLSSGTLHAVWRKHRPVSFDRGLTSSALYSLIAEHRNTSPETLTEIYNSEMLPLKERCFGVDSRPGETEEMMSRGDAQQLLHYRRTIACVLGNPSFPRGLYEEDRWWLLQHREGRRRTFIESTTHMLLPWYSTEEEVDATWALIAGDIEEKPLTAQNAARVLDVAEHYSIKHVNSVAHRMVHETEVLHQPPSSEAEVLEWLNQPKTGVSYWEVMPFGGTYSDETWVAVFNRLAHIGGTAHGAAQNRALVKICNSPRTPDWFKMCFGTGSHFRGYSTGWIAYRGGAEKYAEELGYSNVPLEWAAEVESPAGID